MFLAVGVVIRCGSWRGSPQQLQLTSLQLCCCLLKRCEEKPAGLDGVEKGAGEAVVLLIYLSNLSRLCLLSVRRFNRPCVHTGAVNLTSCFISCFHLEWGPFVPGAMIGQLGVSQVLDAMVP